MPAEWEPHRGTLLAWPHRASDWPGKFAPIPWVYGEIVRILTRYEPVWLIVQNAAHKTAATAVLKNVHVDLNNVNFIIKPTNRGWMRDSGPIVVKNGKKNLALDWRFNAWAKYSDWQLDDKVPAAVAKALDWKSEQPEWNGRRVVLEGGSIDVNGRGSLLTTEECLLGDVQRRNPDFTKQDYESVFAKYLGIEKVVWLYRGIAGDDTHGHVDDIARFVMPNTVVAVIERTRADANYDLLRENFSRLRAVPGLTVVELPMPAPIIFQNQRIPASYANFYIANGVVIVPTFNDINDRNAVGILTDIYPGRDVIGIHCGDLVWGLGTLHCMTQQLPSD